MLEDLRQQTVHMDEGTTRKKRARLPEAIAGRSPRRGEGEEVPMNHDVDSYMGGGDQPCPASTRDQDRRAMRLGIIRCQQGTKEEEAAHRRATQCSRKVGAINQSTHENHP